MDMNDVRFLYQRMPAKVYGRNGESVDGIVLLGEFPTGITVVFHVEQLTGFMQDAVCEIGVVAIAVNKIVSMFPPSYDKLTFESQFSFRDCESMDLWNKLLPEIHSFWFIKTMATHWESPSI